MSSFTPRGVIIVLMILDYYNYVVRSEPSLTESTSVQDMLFDDINEIKKKVWIDVASRLESLETKINELENNDKCGINCVDIDEYNSQTEPNKDSEDGRDDNQWKLLLKGFKAEKLKSRQLETSLKNAYNIISDLESEIRDYKGITTVHTDRINLLEQGLHTVQRDFKDDKQTVASLQKSHNALVHDSIMINETLHAKCDDNSKTINKPTFVSDWILMRVQDPKLSNATVFHGLGILPHKVDVQIQPTAGPNAGWIFPGDSSFQADDDLDKAYGGVTYFYDESNVYLSVPIKSNGKDLGVVINTGESNSRRLGSHHQTAAEAYVRVRAWAPSDLPKPDMMTEWLPVDISNKSLTFYELSHGFMDYPGIVNVQIRCTSSDNRMLISEGMGATLGPRDWANGGGVVHAFNESSVRIWTGYIENLKVQSATFYRLFGSVDGWANVMKGFNVNKGHVRVLAWKQSTVTEKSNVFENRKDNNAITELSTFEHFSAERDLFSLYVEAHDGVNKGFRFPGFGNSQAIGSPFGGVVYAYNPEGGVRTWRPNPETGGHLIHVHSPYGNGMSTQASNNAVYVSSLLRSK